jgi:hypothetical protein
MNIQGVGILRMYKRRDVLTTRASAIFMCRNSELNVLREVIETIAAGSATLRSWWFFPEHGLNRLKDLPNCYGE